MPVPTGTLAAAAAFGSIAVLGFEPPAGLLAVDGVLLALFLVDWAAAPRPSAALDLHREAPGIVPLGGAAEVVWRVRNRTARRVDVRLADQLSPSLRATTRRARLVVPPGGRAVARTAIRPVRRGRFEPSELAVRVCGPMRLAARQSRLSVPSVIRVYPPFRSRADAELRIDRARILEVGLRSAAARGGGTEFDSLREYQPDDEARRIDWAATARAGKPIVRTYRAERNQTVLVLLDCGRTMAARVDDVPRLDHAIDAVMMLTAVATRLGDRAGLVAFDAAVRAVVPPGHGRDQLSRVTEAMYSLEPTLVESDHRGAFVHAVSRFRRRAFIVVLSELSAPAIADTLLPALPLVARDHMVVVAGIRDPALTSWAGDPASEASSAYRRAAAIHALDDRRVVAARLRAIGVTVVDEEPGRLAPALADAYLAAKATGRL